MSTVHNGLMFLATSLGLRKVTGCKVIERIQEGAYTQRPTNSYKTCVISAKGSHGTAPRYMLTQGTRVPVTSCGCSFKKHKGHALTYPICKK